MSGKSKSKRRDSGGFLPNILKKRIDALGYPTLRKFHADRPELGLSYELLRQVAHAGRVPRAETLAAILRAMRYPPSQAQKIMEIAGVSLPRFVLPSAPPLLAEDGSASRGESSVPGPGGDEPGGGAERRGPVPVPVPPAEGTDGPPPLPEDPGEIAASLARCLPRLPYPGNEDFWETAAALARLAERKARDVARRSGDQPLLFEKEPEALYQFLLRRGKCPPFMSRGEGLPLSFREGIDYRDRFRGALLGGCAGEVLGRVAQGLSPRDVESLFGRVDGSFLARAAGEGRRGKPAPPAALLLSRSLLRDGRLDPAAVAAAYAAASPADEFGRNLLERGYPWFEAGSGGPGSSPAARVAPVALLRAADFRRLKLEAGIDASVTHPHPAAVAGAVAQAAAVSALLHAPAGSLDVLGFTRALSHAVAGMEPDRAARSRSGRTPANLWRRIGTELTALLLRRAQPPEIREALGNGPSVFEAIPFAWGCFLRSPDDFEGALLPAVGLGNAAEESGAMTGAMAGAYLGTAGIPKAYADGLPWGEEIAAAADRLLALARKGAEGGDSP